MTALISLIQKGLQHPRRIPTYLSRKLSRLYNEYRWWAYARFNKYQDQQSLIDQFTEGEEFVLVVLDACRFDYFEQNVSEFIPGDLQKVWSPANRTPTWVPAVWCGNHDLTYISSNVYVGDYEYEKNGIEFCADSHIKDIVEAWKFAWDAELTTVEPDTMTDLALKDAAKPGPTRLVVHYLQPHEPYIGESGFQSWLQEVPDVSRNKIDESEKEQFLQSRDKVTLDEVIEYNITWGEMKKYEIEAPESDVRTLLDEGKISEQDLREAYRGNLRLVLQEVRRLVERVDCDVVVTSDHGELLGEDGRYMHDNTTHPILREVPWYTVDNSVVGTHENTAEPAGREETKVEDDTVSERLRNLGYKS